VAGLGVSGYLMLQVGLSVTGELAHMCLQSRPFNLHFPIKLANKRVVFVLCDAFELNLKTKHTLNGVLNEVVWCSADEDVKNSSKSPPSLMFPCVYVSLNCLLDIVV